MMRNAWTGALAAIAMLALTPAVALAEREPAPTQVSLMGPGLGTADLERSVRFYEEGLGLAEIGRLSTDRIHEVMLGFSGGSREPMLILVNPIGKEPEAPSASDKLVLKVSDAEAMRARLTAAGYAPGEMHVHAASGTRIFWVTDPDGHRLEVVQVAAPAYSSGEEE